MLEQKIDILLTLANLRVLCCKIHLIFTKIQIEILLIFFGGFLVCSLKFRGCKELFADGIDNVLKARDERDEQQIELGQ